SPRATVRPTSTTGTTSTTATTASRRKRETGRDAGRRERSRELPEHAGCNGAPPSLPYRTGLVPRELRGCLDRTRQCAVQQSWGESLRAMHTYPVRSPRRFAPRDDDGSTFLPIPDGLYVMCPAAPGIADCS